MAPTELTKAADKIVSRVVPTVHPGTACLFYAAVAQAALREWGWRFSAGGAFLPSSQIYGWGLAVDPAAGRYAVMADKEVDESGEYCGHCWSELPGPPGYVCDLMEGYVGPRRNEGPVIYHHVPSLARSIRRHHAERLKAVADEVRKNKAFCAKVRAWVTTALH